MCPEMSKMSVVLYADVQKHVLQVTKLYIDVQKCVLKMSKMSIVLYADVQKRVLQVTKLCIDVQKCVLKVAKISIVLCADVQKRVLQVTKGCGWCGVQSFKNFTDVLAHRETEEHKKVSVMRGSRK